MRTLIYKRTHSGDPDPVTGVFGNKNCMGAVRGWFFDAVIGVGGTGRKSEKCGIARKLTWIGIGPHKYGNTRYPQITFDHFLYFGDSGPCLKNLAPYLAQRMYDKKARVLIKSFSVKELEEVTKLLSLVRNAPASGKHKRMSQRIAKESKHCCNTARRVDGNETPI